MECSCSPLDSDGKCSPGHAAAQHAAPLRGGVAGRVAPQAAQRAAPGLQAREASVSLPAVPTVTTLAYITLPTSAVFVCTLIPWAAPMPSALNDVALNGHRMQRRSFWLPLCLRFHVLPCWPGISLCGETRQRGRWWDSCSTGSRKKTADPCFTCTKFRCCCAPGLYRCVPRHCIKHLQPPPCQGPVEGISLPAPMRPRFTLHVKRVSVDADRTTGSAERTPCEP